MPKCTNTGFAAALLACLVTTCLMGEAHAYSCSKTSDCAYKGCADVPGVSDYKCAEPGEWYEGWEGVNAYERAMCYYAPGYYCPDPNPCAPGNYSTNGLDYVGDGACKPCDAGSYSKSPGATNCPSAPPSRSKDWGKPEYDHCEQALSWQELIQGDKTGTVTFKTGGLGALMEEEGYETWQCIRDHYCAADAADPWFCFVYHETDKVFTPWGHNAQLKLVSPSPCDCQCSCP